MTSAYQLHNIKVNYQHKCVLDIPELSLPKNECIALLGDNGAGKSTLLNLLGFITQASQGQLLLAGQHYPLPLSAKQRRMIGYVSQHPLLLKGSIADNIALALKFQGIESKQHSSLIEQALDQVNLTSLANQSTDTLSGGELKRAAIARSIACKPDILLLDEPFSHLDQHNYHQLELSMQQFSKQANKTVVFSTHDRLQGIALADSTVNLVKGKVTSSPLVNLFHGQLENHIFNTGKINIHTTSDSAHTQNIAIDPSEIIISNQPLQSSMRNCFSGRLTLIAEEAETIRLCIDCGEKFHVIISQESLAQLSLSLGSTVFLSFKSTATKIF